MSAVRKLGAVGVALVRSASVDPLAATRIPVPYLRHGGYGSDTVGTTYGDAQVVSDAARHPTRVVSASALPGAVAVTNPAVRAPIGESRVVTGGLPGAIDGVAPVDEPGFTQHNPLAPAAALRGMHVAHDTDSGPRGPLTDGRTIADVADSVQATAVQTLGEARNARLDALGIAHTVCDHGDDLRARAHPNRALRWASPANIARVVRAGSLPPRALATAPPDAPARC